MIRYPTASEYVTAVQTPDTVFRRPELRRADFAVDSSSGIPIPAMGSSAVVFKAQLDGVPKALRFLTDVTAGSEWRHSELRHFVVESKITTNVVPAYWYDNGIVLNNLRWPVVEMDWVDGQTLDSHVGSLAKMSDRHALAEMANSWLSLEGRLQKAGFAHGDLNHRKILVDASGTQHLIGLENAWFPGFLAPAPAPRTGHSSYRHPRRHWGRWMDTFPALLILVSLRALAIDPSMWNTIRDHDAMLFTESDLAAPRKTAVWRRIAELGHTDLDALADTLAVHCPPAAPPDCSLASLLPAGSAAVSPGTGHVFISYAREDLYQVRQLVAELQRLQCEVWLDTIGTVGGQDWTEQVVRAIRDAAAIVLVVSTNSMASRAVQREVLYAEDEGRPIVPVVLEEVGHPDWYRFHFRLLHRIDGTRIEQAAQEIVEAVRGQA